jgi:1-acyl-sn-glycerol-3-phosphate acyltransferase
VRLRVAAGAALRRRRADLGARLHDLELGWRLVGGLVSMLTRLVFRVHVAGAERLPRRGPALIVANHVGRLDPVVLAVVLLRRGRHPRFVGLADLWDVPITGRIARITRAIPVQRGAGIEQLVAPTTAALEEGRIVVVYPEGTVASPGQVREGRPGVGALALRTTAPVLPVALWGMHEGAGWWPPLQRRAAVVVGEPVEVGGPAERSTGRGEDRARATSTALLAASTALLPRAQQIVEGRAA